MRGSLRRGLARRSCLEGTRHETHFSAQQHPTQAQPRLSCPHANERWPGRAGRTPGQRPATSERVGTGDNREPWRRQRSFRLSESPKPLGFPRAARLLRGSEYDRVFARAERSRDRFFTVLARRRSEALGRLGLAVSKKAARRAVDRNRIKRLVREGFRRQQADLAGLDIVVIARPGIAGGGNRELSRSLTAHWVRIRRAKDHRKNTC